MVSLIKKGDCKIKMGIETAVVLLTYVTLLILSYAIMVGIKNDGQGSSVINKAYQYYYTILLFNILIIIGLIKLPHITIDSQTTSYLIIASKFISVLTLGGSIYVLSKKKYKNARNE